MTFFKTIDFEIVTCGCFSESWKKIKETGNELWKFDEIENGKKTFRKMFGNERVIFHCCYSCMEKIIFVNETIVTDNRYCIFAVKHDGANITKICSGCIWFFIQKNKNDFYFY